MQKIRGNKWNRRICKWIASLLTAALLVNQSSLSVLAEEMSEAVCQCDIRCSADSVNAGCPVCAQDYGRCEGAEAVTDTDAGEGTENPGEGEDVDIGAEEETENPDAGTDTDTDEVTEDPDADESDTDEDIEDVSDVDAGDEEDALLQEDEAENVAEGDAVSPAAVGTDFTYNEFTYRVTDESNRKAEVTGLAGEMPASGALVIPSNANGYTVVGIGDSAFFSCYALTSITIPSSVKSIGESAFVGCINLPGITIPGGVTSIGANAFFGCSSLASITIPGGVTSIEYGAFQGCSSLSSIVIPSGVTSIGDWAFKGCSNLASITIPGNVTYFGRQAFMGCSNLASITIPDGVPFILESTFEGCSSLTSITIPDSVTFIGDLAFRDCRSLASITIPNSVTSIGVNAFLYCYDLESITIPGSVTSIGAAAFQECTSLESVIISDGVTSIEAGAFSICSSLKNITIPDSVTYIGMSAFSDCSSLESITIPSSVTQVGGIAFWKCSNLTNVKVLSDKTAMVGAAFGNCEKLDSFQIAVSENFTGTLPVGDRCFIECPEDRYLTLLTKDGTTVLSDTTTPTLAAAVKAYDKADGSRDGKWYGWKLPDAPYIPDYQVAIKVNKDGSEWNDCEKTFALSADGVAFITDLTDVSNGTYTIYETTGASDSAGYVNTDITVTVTDADTQAEINYYTVTFYDGDTPFGEPQIVLNNTPVSEPSDSPTKDGYTFYRWVTSKDGSEEFDFINNKITAKTEIYASWTKAEGKTFTITASAGTGGGVSPSGAVTVKSGDDQQFTITPDDGYRVSSVLVDDVEQLSSTQAINHARAGITDAENNAKTYTFENVTDNHSLTAAFTAIGTGGGGSGDNGDDDDPDDNNGGGGSGGGSGTGGSGGGGNTGGGSDGSEGGGSGGSDDIGGDGADGSSNPNGSGNGARATVSDTSVKNGVSVNNVRSTTPASKDSEPKTGDASHMEIYATIAMIAGLSYILLYFADGKNGMTEEEKKEIVAALVTWAKNGSRVKKYAALAVIFLILVYYHSIGKRTTVDWKEVYEK